MKIPSTIKSFCAVSVLALAANAVHAQPVAVSGVFSALPPWSCSGTATGTINIDQDFVTPSPSLGYLFNVTINTPAAGFSCTNGVTTRVFGNGTWTTTLHSEDANFPAPAGIDAIAPFDIQALGSGYIVSYAWGSQSADSNAAASSFTGTYSGDTNNPRWDSAALYVGPTSVLIVKEHGSCAEMTLVYTLQ